MTTDKKEVEFKFKVGDIVLPKDVIHLLDEEFGGWMNDKSPEGVRYKITERWYQECYNTFQIHYDTIVIMRNGGINDKRYRFIENTIEHAPPFRSQEEMKRIREEQKKKAGVSNE